MRKTGKLILRLLALFGSALAMGIFVGLMGDLGLLFGVLLMWIMYDFVK